MLRNLYIKQVERLFISAVLNKEMNAGQYLIVSTCVLLEGLKRVYICESMNT